MRRLSEMRGRFDEGFSSSDRLFIQEMSIAVLHHPVRNTSCKDCYRDAYLEIIHKLKKTGTMPKEVKKFYLRAGVLLHFAGGMYVNENLTDEIAMDSIIENSKRIDLFQKTPDNLEEVLAARKALREKEKPADVSKEDLARQLEGVKSINAELNAKLEGAEKTIGYQNEKIAAMEAELKETKDFLERSKKECQEEIGRLKDEIASKDAKIAELDASPAPDASDEKEVAAKVKGATKK